MFKYFFISIIIFFAFSCAVGAVTSDTKSNRNLDEEASSTNKCQKNSCDCSCGDSEVDTSDDSDYDSEEDTFDNSDCDSGEDTSSYFYTGYGDGDRDDEARGAASRYGTKPGDYDDEPR